jgi:hypothetical protein
MAAEETTSVPPETTVIGVDSTQRNAKPEEAQTLVPVSREGGITQLPLSGALKEIRRINSEAAERRISTLPKEFFILTKLEPN